MAEDDEEKPRTQAQLLADLKEAFEEVKEVEAGREAAQIAKRPAQ